MITVQDVQDALLIGMEKARRNMANIYAEYYEPDVRRDMDITWVKTPDDMKNAMRMKMPQYTQKLDQRMEKKGR